MTVVGTNTTIPAVSSQGVYLISSSSRGGLIKLANHRLGLLGLAFFSACAAPLLAAQTSAQNQPPQKAPTTSSSQIHVPAYTKVTVKYPDSTEVKLSPEEKVAFVFMASIELLEYNCFNADHLGRACSLDELIKGFPAKNGKMFGLSENPNQDSNYHYALSVSAAGDSYQVEAIPQRPGLGGFFSLGKKGGMFGESFYNSKGAATATSAKLGSMSISGPDFRRPAF